MPSSKQGMWKGYHLSIEGIRRGYLFREKWYIKGKGMDRVVEPPRINICWVPPGYNDAIKRKHDSLHQLSNVSTAWLRVVLVFTAFAVCFCFAQSHTNELQLHSKTKLIHAIGLQGYGFLPMLTPWSRLKSWVQKTFSPKHRPSYEHFNTKKIWLLYVVKIHHVSLYFSPLPPQGTFLFRFSSSPPCVMFIKRWCISSQQQRKKPPCWRPHVPTYGL